MCVVLPVCNALVKFNSFVSMLFYSCQFVVVLCQNCQRSLNDCTFWKRDTCALVQFWWVNFNAKLYTPKRRTHILYASVLMYSSTWLMPSKYCSAICGTHSFSSIFITDLVLCKSRNPWIYRKKHNKLDTDIDMEISIFLCRTIFHNWIDTYQLLVE